MNRDLREYNENILTYYPFIKKCYKAIRNNYLKPIINENLYRGQQMDKEEYNNLYNLYENRNNDLQKILIWSKTFLSFSKDIDIARRFIEFNNNFVRILFVTLGYLGKYKNEMKKQLKNLEEININNKFTEFLISNGIMKSGLINPIWLGKGRININIINICFLLDNNLIYIFSINGKIKQTIEAFNDDILCIIKLEKEKICSSCIDNTIKIIQLLENNQKYEITKIIQLGVSFAKSIIYLMNNNIIIFKSNNDIDLYDLNNDNNITILKDEINNIMKFHNNNIVYITKQNNIYFLKIIIINNNYSQ